MITAVDTNVLLDMFLPNALHSAESEKWLYAAYRSGAILVCAVVYAELVPAFVDRPSLDASLRDINAVVSPIDQDIAWEAGLRWHRYRQAGGPRGRILADFLIGAHATITADAFLTRDLGFYATYFPELQGA